MSRKETVKSGLRIIEEEIPSLIIRELLSNAMIHQNLNPVATHILIKCFKFTLPEELVLIKNVF